VNRFKWEKHYLYWGVTAFLVVVCSILFYSVVTSWSYWWGTFQTLLRIMSPIFWGLILAYFLTPLAKLLERLLTPALRSVSEKRPRLGNRLSRALSVLLAVLITLFAVTLLLITLLPEVYSSIEALVINSPIYLTVTVAFLQQVLDNIPALEAVAINLLEEGENLLLGWVNESLLPNIDLVILSVSAGFFGVVRVVVNLVIGLILSIYLMYNRELFAAQSRKLLHSLMPENRVTTMLRGVRHVDKTFGRYFLGRVLDSLFIGTFTFIFLTVMDMPYVALVTVVISITNTIPFFGPFIGAIPSAVLIFMEDPVQGLIFVVFIIVLQQISGNITGPRIMANTMGLSGFWILFSILVGGGLFGFLGMLLGVPVFSLIYDVIRYLTNRRLSRQDMPTDTQAYAKKPAVAIPAAAEKEKAEP